MKKKLFVTLGLATIIGASLTAGAYAGANLESIQAYLNKGVSVKLNGQAWQPKDSTGANTYPITYNNTTWLPVKSIGDALGVKVGWDAASNSVLIGDVAVSTSTDNVTDKTADEKLALDYINIFLSGDDKDTKQKFLDEKIDPEMKSLFSLVTSLGISDKVVYTNLKVEKSIDYTFENKKGTLVLVQSDQDEIIIYIRDNKIAYSYLSSAKDDVSKKAYAELRSKFN